MVRLNEVTSKATVDQIKYWCKLLGIRPVIISRASHVTATQCDLIKRMADLIEHGTRPRDAALMLEETAVTVSPDLCTLNKLQVETTERIDSLEKAVMLLVEQNKKLAEKLDMQGELQNKKLESIHHYLTQPRIKAKKFKLWEPQPKRRSQFSFLQKFWYELVDPAKLRAD